MSAAIANSRAEAERDYSLATRLQKFLEIENGAGSRVVNLAVMEDGHAGLTFGFDIVDAVAGTPESFVLKLAPAGVTRRGNTDVYRQAPLLRALKAAGMPVPAVPWASPDDGLLGTPFIVMERLPGRVFLVWEPHGSFPRDAIWVRQVWLQAAQMLARLHKVNWQTSLPNWEKPRPLVEELDFWTPLLRHAQEGEWLEAGTELRTVLAAHLPDGHPVGIVHGDFQPGNILYVDGRADG
jgi:aminoglycoside phosphotransferase (APT) family kinase protein